jgi:hypothetical protein
VVSDELPLTAVKVSWYSCKKESADALASVREKLNPTWFLCKKILFGKSQ